MSEKIVQLSEEVIKGQIKELVRGVSALPSPAFSLFSSGAEGIKKQTATLAKQKPIRYNS